MERSPRKLVSLKFSPQNFKFCKSKGEKSSANNSDSQSKNNELIESTHGTDDFNDIKEILSLISPRELSKPHHYETTATLIHDAKSIAYLAQEYDSKNKSSCNTPESNYQKNKDFIIRKHVPVRLKTKIEFKK